MRQQPHSESAAFLTRKMERKSNYLISIWVVDSCSSTLSCSGSQNETCHDFWTDVEADYEEGLLPELPDDLSNFKSCMDSCILVPNKTVSSRQPPKSPLGGFVSVQELQAVSTCLGQLNCRLNLRPVLDAYSACSRIASAAAVNRNLFRCLETL